jgi:hypothetical protein
MSLHDDYSTCTLPSSVSASPTIDISEEEEDDEEGDMMIIPQNLSLEEQNYQFPMIQYDQEQIGTDPFIVTQKHHQGK